MTNSSRVKTACSHTSSQGIIFSPVSPKDLMHCYYAPKSGEETLWECSALAGGREGRCHTQNDPHVQFWDEKLEGRMGAGLLLSSGLCRHMVIIWSSFEHAASLLMKRAVVQYENRAASTKGQFPPTAITKREPEDLINSSVLHVIPLINIW